MLNFGSVFAFQYWYWVIFKSPISGLPKAAFVANSGFVPCHRQGISTKTAKMASLRSTHTHMKQLRPLLLRPRENDELTQRTPPYYRKVADVWKKDVWEFQAKSGSSGSCRLFLHFLRKIAVRKMSGRTPGSPRHPSCRHPRPSDTKKTTRSKFATRSVFSAAGWFTIAAHLVRTPFSWEELQTFFLSKEGPRRSTFGGHGKNTTA